MTVTLATQAFSAAPDTRVYEMRTYFASEGKLDELHARFRDHTTRLFEKHGMTNLGYWVPIENPERRLIYVLSYPSREARENSWKAFAADPEWQKAHAASEVNGKLVSKVEELFLEAVDYSPAIAPNIGTGERVFELRTYTTTPGNLGALHSRFRDHTVSLFAKHGMTTSSTGNRWRISRTRKTRSSISSHTQVWRRRRSRSRRSAKILPGWRRGRLRKRKPAVR
jgi:hypothetical protein